MRSEINALWARVRALQRKLARELAAYRLDLLSQPFIRRVIDAGYRLLPLAAANNYLQDCLRKDTAPDPETLLNVILPSAGKIQPAGSPA